MKNTLTILLFLCAFYSAKSQEKFLTKNGTITFFSKAPLENIEAENKQVLSIVDATNGNMAISILMKSFLFEKALMQEHFNDNYVESDKFPKANFKGAIVQFETISEKPKLFQVKGALTIHGKTKDVTIEATIQKNNNEIKVIGDFMINLEDYDVKIPAIVAKNIAKNIKVNFDFNHKPFQK